MKVGDGSRRWVRRARPLLGTLVEVGFAVGVSEGADALNSHHPTNARNTSNEFSAGNLELAVQAAFDAIADVQRCLSTFDSNSDLARNANSATCLQRKIDAATSHWSS